MLLPVVLVWMESLAPDVVRAAALATGIVPGKQTRQVRVSLSDLDEDTRAVLATCLRTDRGLVIAGMTNFSRTRAVRLAEPGWSTDMLLPAREVAVFAEDHVEYASAQVRAAAAYVPTWSAIEEAAAAKEKAREAEAAAAKLRAREAAENRAREAAEEARRYQSALHALVQEHGTEVDMERLSAGVYPRSEALSLARSLVLAPLDAHDRYAPIQASDISHGDDCLHEESMTCRTDDYDDGLPEMDAKLWTDWQALRAAVPSTATLSLRRHYCTCDGCMESCARWSALVRVPTALPDVVASVRLAIGC